MRSPRHVARRLRALREVGRRAADAHGANPLRAALRAQRLRRRQSFDLDEALSLGLLDPAVPDEVAAGHVSKHRALQVQRRLNAQELEHLTEDKLVFYRLCEGSGLPVPELLAIVPRHAPGSSRAGRILSDETDWRACLREDLPDEIVVKPALGYHGLGVQVLRQVDGMLERTSGERVDPDRLYREMRSDPEFATFLVQERLRDEPELRRLGNGTALQTLRIGTFVERSGRIRVIYALLRLALGEVAIDNFRSGTTGNALVDVDVDTGELGPVMVARPDGAGLCSMPDDPVAGRRVQGVRLGRWAEARALVEAAGARFLPLRTLGWDVALTTRGPVIVEANMWWDPWGDPRLAALFEELERGR